MIVGAGGHGRCCLDIARESYDEICFLDDCLVGQIVNDAKVIGTVDEMSSYYLEYTKIFIAVGNNKVREKLTKQAIEIGYEVVTLISSKATVSSYASIGLGSVVFSNAVIEANATLGNSSIIAANTTVNHDAVIDNYCLVNTVSVIRPNVLLGKNSHISSHCLISANTKLKPNSFIEDGIVVRKGELCIIKGLKEG